MRPSEILKKEYSNILKLARECSIEQIRVFGSVARGTDTEQSDVDLFAIYSRGATILSHAAFTHRIKTLLKTDCDVICDEMQNLDAFKHMQEISVSLDDFVRGIRVQVGEVSKGERNNSASDNIAWVISRIQNTVRGVDFQTFINTPELYDALAYQLMLLGSIVENADLADVEAYQIKFSVDLSGAAELKDILLTSVYPKMVYEAASLLSEC